MLVLLQLAHYLENLDHFAPQLVLLFRKLVLLEARNEVESKGSLHDLNQFKSQLVVDRLLVSGRETTVHRH